MRSRFVLIEDWDDIERTKLLLLRDILTSRNQKVSWLYARIIDLIDRLAKESDCFPLFVKRTNTPLAGKKRPGNMVVRVEICFISPQEMLAVTTFNYRADPVRDYVAAWVIPPQKAEKGISLPEATPEMLMRMAGDITSPRAKSYSEMPLRYHDGTAFAPWLIATSNIVLESDFDWITSSLVSYISLMRSYDDTNHSYFKAITPPSTPIGLSWLVGYSTVGVEEADMVAQVGSGTAKAILGIKGYVPISPCRKSPQDSLVFVSPRKIVVDLSLSGERTLAENPYCLVGIDQTCLDNDIGNENEILNAILLAQLQRG